MEQRLNLSDYYDISGFDRYIVDVGAQVGPGPLYHYLHEFNYDGLCIEGDSASYATLCGNLPAANINKICKFVTPDNIIDIFRECSVPKSPLAIKLDIDGYDYFVLDKILSEYSPAFIVAEINEKIPPPIEFETLYRTDYVWKFTHLFGFSLQSAVKLMKKHNYTIIGLHGGNNVVCINNNIAHNIQQTSVSEIYKRDYLNNYNVFKAFPWNANVNHWTTNPDIDGTISDITDYFISSCGASIRHFTISKRLD